MAWTLIRTTLGGGFATLGGGVTILGVVAILGCRSVKHGFVRLNSTSRINWVVALGSTDGVGGAETFVVGGAGNGVGRSMAIFGIQFF